MAAMMDDLATRIKSISDSIDKSLTSFSTDLGLGSKLKGLRSEFGGVSGRPAAGGGGTGAPRSEAERAAARQRGEAALAALPPGYCERGFDALRHELAALGDDAKQEDIDGVVERLVAAMEVVGVRLAKHVLKHQDKLIAGVTNVTSVQDDLSAAHVICRGSRAQLRLAAEDVQHQIRVITCTRRKQASMQALEAAGRIKRVKDLHVALRKAHEEGDHSEAVLLCIDGSHAVEELAGYKAAPELRLTVQRHLYDALQRLDAALLNECSSFTAEGYSKLLEAFVLQGLPGPSLASKVLCCFKDCINDAASRLLRSMVLAKAAFGGGSGGASSGDSPRNRSGSGAIGDCSYEELCRLVPADMLAPCLSKFLEACFELLRSYHTMAAWHTAGLQQQDHAMAAAAAAAAAAAEAAGAAAGQQSAGPSAAALEQVGAATRDLLAAVAGGLADSRAGIADVIASRVRELLAASGARCRADDFPAVVEGVLQLVSVAEAFAAASLPLRGQLLTSLAGCVDGYHRGNMEALRLALALESWQPVSGAAGAGGTDAAAMRQYLQASPYLLPALGEPGSVSNFEAWLQAGNPFQGRMRAVGAKRAMQASQGQAAQASPSPSEPAAAATSSSSSTAAAAASAASGGRVTTKSGLLVLRWMGSYAALLPLLQPSKQAVLWAGLVELFDNFLLACFILFSGVSLEALVWQEESLPHRLRSALLRIMTCDGCKYKLQVEELQRSRPAPSQLLDALSGGGSSSSFLDFGFGSSNLGGGGSNLGAGGGSGSSKLDAFTKKFKDTMVELINTDLSQPLPSSSAGSSPAAFSSPVAGQGVQGSQVQAQQRQPGQQVQQQQQHRMRAGSLVPCGSTPAAAAAAGAAASAGERPVSNAAAPAAATQPSSGAGEQQQQQQLQGGVPGHSWGLQERVLAMESLAALADTLKGSKAALQAALAAAGLGKEVDGYCSRTVDAAQDLRDAIYRGAARQLLAAVVDAERGTAAQIAGCNYNVREPAARYQPWVEALVKQFKGLAGLMVGSGLPADVQAKMWEAAVKVGSEAMLDGLGRVRRCSLEGRAGMSLDLSAVEKALRGLAPGAALASLRLVDGYIKAFYTPWDDLGRWAQVHLAEYGKARLLVLIEAMAEAYSIKRGAKAALLDKLNAELAEFA